MKHALMLSLSLLAAGAAQAQSGGMKGMETKDMHKGMDMKSEKKDQVHKATGTVTKVDSAGGRITINHGPVASMSWPSMTMAFDVKDKKLAEKVKQGDKVEFEFTSSGRKNVITSIK